MLISILLVLHVIVAIVIIGAVLLQQGQGANAGAAFGSGASGTVFGAQGAASFLSRMTAVLATVFMLNSTALAWMAARDMGEGSVFERTEQMPTVEQELVEPLDEADEADDAEDEDEDDGLDLPPPDGL